MEAFGSYLFERGKKMEIFTLLETLEDIMERSKNIPFTEKGIVETYFANTFGPYQRKEKVDTLLEIYFSKMIMNNVFIGEIYTCLGVEGKEQIGPKLASEELLKVIKK